MARVRLVCRGGRRAGAGPRRNRERSNRRWPAGDCRRCAFQFSAGAAGACARHAADRTDEFLASHTFRQSNGTFAPFLADDRISACVHLAKREARGKPGSSRALRLDRRGGNIFHHHQPLQCSAVCAAVGGEVGGPTGRYHRRFSWRDIDDMGSADDDVLRDAAPA